MPNFSLTATGGMTWNESNGVVSVEINFEGTADGYGTVLGTYTGEPAGAPSGTYKYVGSSFSETGDQSVAIGSGEWTKLDGDNWSTTGATTIDNNEFKVEGRLRLSDRSWSGTFG
jgi:hypothetical protein